MQYLVHLAEGHTQADLVGVTVVKTWAAFPRTVLIEIPESEVATVEHSAAVLNLSPNREVSIDQIDLDLVMSASYASSWGARDIGADLIHARGNMGDGVRVVILDTGVDTDHEDLIIAGGSNFVTPGAPPEDDNGHGTHVHGIIGAQLNGKGVAGVAPHAEVYHAKVMDENGTGSFDTILDGLAYAIALAPCVCNNSYSSSSHPGDAIEAAYQAAADAGVILLGSSGNTGTVGIGYPARFPSVAAIGSSTERRFRSTFSSYGPELVLLAPGSNVLSTVPGGYGTKSGTSMACPHAVGAVALALSAGVADPIAALPMSGTYYPDRYSDNVGHGYLNATKLVQGGDPDGERYTFTGPRLRLDASSSFDMDGTIVTWQWEIRRAGEVEREIIAMDTPILERDFDAGEWGVGLRVIDDDGDYGVNTRTIIVNIPGEETPLPPEPENQHPVPQCVIFEIPS